MLIYYQYVLPVSSWENIRSTGVPQALSLQKQFMYIYPMEECLIVHIITHNWFIDKDKGTGLKQLRNNPLLGQPQAQTPAHDGLMDYQVTLPVTVSTINFLNMSHYCKLFC